MDMAEHQGNLMDDLIADLITTNELGEGEREYRVVGDDLFLDVYESGLTGEDGFPIPDATYHIGVTITRIEEEQG